MRKGDTAGGVGGREKGKGRRGGGRVNVYGKNWGGGQRKGLSLTVRDGGEE